jgi:type IV pilus assembly protein PilY1
MNLRKLAASIATTAVLVFPGAAAAVFDPVGDDTDIFLANPLLEATRPNVMILVDNTANWSTPFDTEKQALINIVNNLVTDQFNVGLAMFVETGGDNDSIDGGYIRFGIRQMTPTNKARFTTMVSALDRNGDKSNNAVYSGAMGELYRYFSGSRSRSGYGKAKRDYPGNIDYNPLAADLPGWPFPDDFSDTYISPIVSPCQKNFIIVISNGKLNITSENDTAGAYLSTLVNKTPPDTISLAPKPTGEQAEWGDEYAKFMANADCAPLIDGVQNVITYTIDVLPGVAGNADHTAYLQSMADNGKGRYFVINDMTSSAALEDALRQIFQEVQAVNSVFASVALPVSVNVRGTNLNQVYIGQFRPDPRKSPRWFGNLKMYKIGQDASGNAFLVDSLGNRAENAATGFVSPNAQSFWTTASTFWNHRPADENGASGNSDLPDGDLVEKGGAAEGLRVRYPTDQAQRQVYTCVSSSGYCASGSLLSASPFSVSNADVTAGDLAIYTKKPVVSITAALVGTTPTATARVTAHGWATGNTVRISGASPSVYNQTATITVVDANTFTYVLPSLPPANIARGTGTNHGLVSGDLIDVTGSATAGYNVTNASITRIDADNFEYGMSAGATVASSGHTVTGKKLATSVTGSGTSATATVPNHGYPNGSMVSITGANEAAFNVVPPATVAVTVVNASTFTYNTLLPISGTASTARVTALAHGFSTGQTVSITGSSVSTFNGSFLINVADANTFTYTVSGSASTATNAGMVASIGISQITHPTSGGAAARDVATVTTAVAHNFANGQTIIISGTGGVPPAGYNGTWFISGVTAPGQTTFRINDPANTPAASLVGTVDGSPTPLAIAGMRAGRPVTQIDPVVTATGTIRSARPVSLATLSSKAAATGSILAGRPTDIATGERDNLILWARGRDNAENEKANVTAPDVRPSIHGDVLHSRPAVVNYGRDANDHDVTIFYGANDGGLRAVKGGTATVSGDLHPDGTAVRPGDERWSFIPRELMSKLERQMLRSPAITADNPRDYFVDGAISAFTKDVNEDGKLKVADGDKVYLYAAMRRGGDFLYALDVADPGAPRFMWRKQAGDTGYGELGQTWSEAKVTRIRANTRPADSPSGNPDNLVLVMGAGYDPAVEDIPPCLLSAQTATNVTKRAVGTGLVTYTSSGTCTVSGATGSATTINRTKGRGILVVDALDGHVIWQAGPSPMGATHNVTIPDMSYAIPSDVRVVDLNGDGFADSAFVGDTGGQVWRLDMADADPRNWKVRKIATLSSSVDSDIPNKRKFLFAPEVTIAEDATGVFLAVLIGAGDREHPFDGLVANTFYMLKDRAETATLGSGSGTRSWTQTTSVSSAGSGGSPVAGGVIRDADLFDATSTAGSSTSGWKRQMLAGEKIVSSALVVNGTAIFSSNQPTVLSGGAVDACASNLGVARIYEIAVADGTTEVTIRAGGGYVPSPVFAAIQIGNTGGTTTTIPTSSTGVCTGAACGNSTTSGGGTPPGGPTTGVVCTGTTCWSVGTLDVGSRKRAYWYREID